MERSSHDLFEDTVLAFGWTEKNCYTRAVWRIRGLAAVQREAVTLMPSC